MGKILRGKHERRGMDWFSVFSEAIWDHLFNIQTNSEANKNKQDFKPNKQGEEMNELKEFTAAEMRGCPPFEVKIETYRDWFVKSNGESITWYCGERYYPYMDKGDGFGALISIECNPIDRMNAIAKHLFELMPIKRIEQVCDGVIVEDYNDFSIQISINPFLHTDRTEITREELGL